MHMLILTHTDLLMLNKRKGSHLGSACFDWQAALADLTNQKSTPLGLIGARLARQPPTQTLAFPRVSKAQQHHQLSGGV